MATSERIDLEIEKLSNTQENRITNQIGRFLDKSGMRCTGEGSKYETLQAKRDEGAKGSQETHDGVKFFSYDTEDSAISCFRQFMRFEYNEYGLKQIEQTKPEMIKAFAAHLVDVGASQNTFSKYMTALAKLDNILEKATGIRVNWENTLKEVRPMVKDCPNKEHSRAYDNPRAIVNELTGNERIAAQLQLFCGLRISDATYISADRWDARTGEGVANSKGGQKIVFRPPASVAAAITAEINENGKFSAKDYSEALRGACERVGEDWNGSHGLRHNFAQEKMESYTKGGLSYREALSRTSEDMGHHRPEITEHYLR